jgi:spermidine synthase
MALIAAILLAACAPFTAPSMGLAQAQTYPRDIYVGKGMFGDIIVYDDWQGFRTLEFKRGAARHSLVKPGDPLHIEFEYARIVTLTPALARKPLGRVLILGLGGGTLPMFFRTAYPQARIDVAEIDPAVVSVAERYFGFKQDANLQVLVGDGRAIVERAPRAEYDVVILDAYGENDTAPRHLLTVEFLRAVRAITRPDGVVVSNIWGPNLNSRYYDSMATHAAAFDEIFALYSLSNVNVVAFALPRKEGVTQARMQAHAREFSTLPAYRHDLRVFADKAWLDLAPAAAKGTVLRDAARP